MYFTFGIRIFTNAGASAGGDWTFILDIPADFAGPYIGVGASVGPLAGDSDEEIRGPQLRASRIVGLSVGTISETPLVRNHTLIEVSVNRR